MNDSDTGFVLAIGWVLQAMRNTGQHPILILVGAEGSAKSTVTAMLKALIDPSSADPTGLPKSERELLRQAYDSYVLAWDNVSSIPTALSDALCRFVTGPRSRPVIINSIADFVLSPDLTDRCLFVSCGGIFDSERRTRAEIWRNFEQGRPHFLGALFDIAVQGMAALPRIRPDRLPRMADFARWAMACERAIWPEGTFIAAYEANRAEAAEALIDNDPVSAAVRALMDSRSTWEGNATKLLIALGPIFDRWGKAGASTSPRALSGRVRKAAALLQKIGITVEFERLGHSRDRMIRICRTGEPEQAAGNRRPPEPPPSQPAPPTPALPTPPSCSEPAPPQQEGPAPSAPSALSMEARQSAPAARPRFEPEEYVRTVPHAIVRELRPDADGADGSWLTAPQVSRPPVPVYRVRRRSFRRPPKNGNGK
jgi:hypothetical protein